MFLLEHDLFRKPVPTFRDHALPGPLAAPDPRLRRAGGRLLAPQARCTADELPLPAPARRLGFDDRRAPRAYRGRIGEALEHFRAHRPRRREHEALAEAHVEIEQI